MLAVEDATKAYGKLEGGNLVSDELMLELVEERLADEDCSNGFVLDGDEIDASGSIEEISERIGNARDAGNQPDGPAQR